jgi:hypothetical protein
MHLTYHATRHWDFESAEQQVPHILNCCNCAPAREIESGFRTWTRAGGKLWRQSTRCGIKCRSIVWWLFTVGLFARHAFAAMQLTTIFMNARSRQDAGELRRQDCLETVSPYAGLQRILILKMMAD